MTKYIANSFSPSMIPVPGLVRFKEIDANEFCDAVKDTNTINSIGHEGTITVVNSLCQSNLKVNRIMIKTQPGDIIYIFGLMARIEEGKVLSANELKELMSQGKIKFLKAEVYQDVIDELRNCQGKCDERLYDYLASQLLENIVAEEVMKE